MPVYAVAVVAAAAAVGAVALCLLLCCALDGNHSIAKCCLLFVCFAAAVVGLAVAGGPVRC